MRSSSKKKYDTIERLELIISGILRLSLILAAVYTLIQGRWSHLFTIILTFTVQTEKALEYDWGTGSTQFVLFIITGGHNINAGGIIYRRCHL